MPFRPVREQKVLYNDSKQEDQKTQEEDGITVRTRECVWSINIIVCVCGSLSLSLCVCAKFSGLFLQFFLELKYLQQQSSTITHYHG